MLRSLFASAALVAAVHATGQAIVVNSCSYDVYLSNTPALGGGFSIISQTLSPGGSYSQTYTELSNSNGWSLKLSKDPNAYSSNILQYEYTYHNDGTIWYDLSEVNGNPWDGNWEITATNGCTPRQAAYRFATDDAYGMQACDSSASITVTLCSGESSGGSSPPATGWGSTPPATSSSTPSLNLGNKAAAPQAPPVGDVVNNSPSAPAVPAVPSPAPQEPSTTLTTAAAPPPSSAPWNGPAVTVTNVHMETMTQYVTASAAPVKHHHHPGRHAHRRV